MTIDETDRTQIVAPTVLLGAFSIAQRTAMIDALGGGYRLLFAADLRQAMARITTHSVDVIVLDATRHNPAIIHLLRQLRADPSLDSVAVILLTNADEHPFILDCLQHGANDVLLLPLSEIRVRMRLQKWLNVRRQIQQRDQTIRQLEQTCQTQTRLMQMAIHDLRHPITNLRIAGTMLQNYAPQDPVMEPVVSAMLSAAATMAEMFEDFTSAFNPSHEALTLEPVSAQAVIDNVALQYLYTALNKGITIEIGAQDGRLTAEPVHLENALSNLVSNAVKYSPPNTTIHLWSEVRGDEVILSVQDQGAGVPPEERHLLFTAFGKLSTRLTGDEPSVGLGLWIVNQAIGAMGGRVGADFPDAGGSVFWIALPAG